MWPAVESLGATLFAGVADADVGAAAAAAAAAAVVVVVVVVVVVAAAAAVAGGWLFQPVGFAARRHGQAAGPAVPTYLPGTGRLEKLHAAVEQGTLGMLAVGPDMPFVRLGGAAGVRVAEHVEGVAQAAGSDAAGATAGSLMRSSDAETEIVDAARNNRVRPEDQQGQWPSQTWAHSSVAAAGTGGTTASVVVSQTVVPEKDCEHMGTRSQLPYAAWLVQTLGVAVGEQSTEVVV